MFYAQCDDGQWVITLPRKEHYTVHEVQRLLGLSTSSTVYNMLERGELEGPCTLDEGQCVSHSSLVELVRIRGPVLRHEAARKKLVTMLQEVVNETRNK